MEFEKHLQELEEINSKMSSGELKLKESIETFKKGMELIKKCRKELNQAEQSVKKLVKIDEETGQAQFEDFSTSKEE